MKNSWIYLMLLLSLNFLQAQEEEPEFNSPDIYRPLLGDINAFSLNGQGAIEYTFLDGDFVDVALPMFHFSASNSVTLSMGSYAEAILDPILVYVNPQFRIIDRYKFALALSFRHLSDKDFENFYANPEILASIGTTRKNLTIGYSLFYDYQESNIITQDQLEFLYSYAGLRLDGFIMVHDQIGLFLKNKFLFTDAATLVNSDVGVNFIGGPWSGIIGLKNLFWLSGGSDGTSNLFLSLSFNF